MVQKQYSEGSGKNLVILLTGKEESSVAESLFQLIIAQLPSADFSLITYEASDWDAEYSPWPFVMANGRSFPGGGRDTLQKIVSLMDKAYEHVFLAGYSLAGLFSLWAIHETELFDGCACCSGSLWFEGWEEYSKIHSLKKPGILYLSLGGKEDKVKNPVLSTIGEKTKAEDKRNALDPRVKDHTLVMNPGGHFASPDKRLAQGIVWLLQNEFI